MHEHPKKLHPFRAGAVGREQTFPILEEWFSKQTPLRCELRYGWVIGVVRGSLKELSIEELLLVSGDGQSEVTVGLSNPTSLAFSWGGSTLPGHGRVVVISFGLRETGPVDSVAFAEIKP